MTIFESGEMPSPMGCAEGLAPCLIGEFSALLAMRPGKFPNKLRYFPLANIRAAASNPFLHFQPSLFRWLHHPPCELDLLLLLYRLCRLGQGLTAQVVVQVLILTIVH